MEPPLVSLLYVIGLFVAFLLGAWVYHVGRAGRSPVPPPVARLFKARDAEAQGEEDEPRPAKPKQARL